MSPSSADAVQTLIFVDVDGVLNVGIKDGTRAPLLLRGKDVELAVKLSECNYGGAEAMSVARLSNMAKKTIGHDDEGATFMKFATMGQEETSDVLVSRLAKIIQAAGDEQLVKVVLSSSWRRPQHTSRRLALEKHLSQHLGFNFEFHATTRLDAAENKPSDRLQTIGDYLADYCAKQSSKAVQIRAVILEDFFISALDGWMCGGKRIDSAAAAEEYIQGRVSRAGGKKTTVKLAHTYDSWKTESGLEMQVGMGLSQRHFSETITFLKSAEKISLTSLGRQETESTVASEGDAALTPSSSSSSDVKVAGDEAGWMKVVTAFFPPMQPMVVGI